MKDILIDILITAAFPLSLAGMILACIWIDRENKKRK